MWFYLVLLDAFIFLVAGVFQRVFLIYFKGRQMEGIVIRFSVCRFPINFFKHYMLLFFKHYMLLCYFVLLFKLISKNIPFPEVGIEVTIIALTVRCCAAPRCRVSFFYHIDITTTHYIT